MVFYYENNINDKNKDSNPNKKSFLYLINNNKTVLTIKKKNKKRVGKIDGKGNNMMNHPLAMVDNDDDISSVIIKPSAADTKMNNRVTMTPQPSDTDNKLDQQSLTMTATKFKAKVNKRMAPKAPDEQHIPTTSIDKPLCFFMPVEHVRWFYKTEKDKHHHSSTASTNGTGATTIIDKPTDPNNISPNGYPSNDPNNNVIKITVNT